MKIIKTNQAPSTSNTRTTFEKYKTKKTKNEGKPHKARVLKNSGTVIKENQKLQDSEMVSIQF